MDRSDSELHRAGEASGGAFSCLLVDAAVTLPLMQAMSRGNELAIAIFGLLGPYIAAIASIEARGRSMPVLHRRRVLPAA